MKAARPLGLCGLIAPVTAARSTPSSPAHRARPLILRWRKAAKTPKAAVLPPAATAPSWTLNLAVTVRPIAVARSTILVLPRSDRSADPVPRLLPRRGENVWPARARLALPQVIHVSPSSVRRPPSALEASAPKLRVRRAAVSRQEVNYAGSTTRLPAWQPTAPARWRARQAMSATRVSVRIKPDQPVAGQPSALGTLLPGMALRPQIRAAADHREVWQGRQQHARVAAFVDLGRRQPFTRAQQLAAVAQVYRARGESAAEQQAPTRGPVAAPAQVWRSASAGDANASMAFGGGVGAQAAAQGFPSQPPFFHTPPATARPQAPDLTGLVDEVMRRIERQMRSERLRRGI